MKIRTLSGARHVICFTDNCGSNQCFTFYENFLAWEKPGIGRECFFMVLQGVVYFIVVLVAEMGIFRKISNSCVSSGNPTAVGYGNLMGSGTMGEEVMDSDVASEKNRINSTSVEELLTTDSLILKVSRTLVNL